MKLFPLSAASRVSISGLVVITAAACTGGGEQPDDTAPPAVLLEADEHGFLQGGTADVEVSVLTMNRGKLRVLAGPDGRAVRFPEFEDTGAGAPLAVVVVRGSAPQLDQLSPGDKDFSFGATVMLDARSEGSDVDNGNNMIQRGVSGDPAMFKAEVDAQRPACTVYGSDGMLTVRAVDPVEPGRWYTIDCERRANTLTVRVRSVVEDGQERTTEHEASGPIGTVVIDPPTTPISIGGKLNADGQIMDSASDQFNGRMLEPYLTIQQDDD